MKTRYYYIGGALPHYENLDNNLRTILNKALTNEALKHKDMLKLLRLDKVYRTDFIRLRKEDYGR